MKGLHSTTNEPKLILWKDKRMEKGEWGGEEMYINREEKREIERKIRDY